MGCPKEMGGTGTPQQNKDKQGKTKETKLTGLVSICFASVVTPYSDPLLTYYRKSRDCVEGPATTGAGGGTRFHLS